MYEKKGEESRLGIKTRNSFPLNVTAFLDQYPKKVMSYTESS
jgi:hypothetical protein